MATKEQKEHYKGDKNLDNYPDGVIPSRKKLVDKNEVVMDDDEYTTRVDESCDNYDEAQKPTPPSSSEAFDKIQQYFIDVESGIDAGLDRMDALLNSYPTVDRAINQENYSLAENRVKKAEKDNLIDTTERDYILGVFSGTN